MKNDRFKQICHFVAGLILTPFAFKLFEQKHFLYCVIVLSFAVLFLFVSATHEWLEKKIGEVVKLFFLLESILFLFVSFINFEKGKKMPTYAYGLVGVIYFMLFIYFLYSKDKAKKHRKHRHHRSGHHSSSESSINN